MKRILLSLSAIIAVGIGASAQMPDELYFESDDSVQIEMITPAMPVQETEQEIKEREKRLRELEDDVAYAKASNSMRRGYFVLVADYIQIGHTGYRRYDISPNSNFILVQGDDGIIQFAFNTGGPGSNGLGGWTGKGHVRNKTIKELDNGDVVMQFHLMGAHVDCTVHITLYHNSKRALACILDGSDITFYGEILPYRDSDHR